MGDSFCTGRGEALCGTVNHTATVHWINGKQIVKPLDKSTQCQKGKEPKHAKTQEATGRTCGCANELLFQLHGFGLNPGALCTYFNSKNLHTESKKRQQVAAFMNCCRCCRRKQQPQRQQHQKNASQDAALPRQGEFNRIPPGHGQ